jgi:hypothetical protein
LKACNRKGRKEKAAKVVEENPHFDEGTKTGGREAEPA